jgi:hypothetical protein
LPGRGGYNFEMPLPPTNDPDRRVRRAAVASFAFLTVFFTGAFPPFANPNELSRFEAVYAMGEQGTFAIDGAIARFGDHEDKAASGGHVYSNKAPGLAFAAVPVYRLLRLLLPPPASGTAGPLFVLLHLATVGLVSVVAVARLSRRLPPPATPVVAALALGTPLLYYSRTFLSHAWSAALLFLAWDALRVAEQRTSHRRVGPFVFLCGLLAGWATISEYTVAPFAALLVLRAGAGRKFRRVPLAAAGAAVPVALLAAYQAMCFGSPFTPSYAKEAFPAYAELARQPLFGLTWPQPALLLDYLFHPARGILVFSPFLAWAAAGFFKWWRSREDRPDCLFALASTVVFFLLMSGYPNWHGGWSLGSRYLLPSYFFLALAAGRALTGPLSRRLFGAAAAFSVASHCVLTLTWPHFPTNMPWPVATGSAWFLSRGWIAQTLLPSTVAGRAVAAAVAVAAAAVGLLPALKESGPGPHRGLAWAALGLAPLAVLLARPPELTFGGRLWRAAVFGKFSGLDPSREELRRVIAAASTPSEKRRAEDAWRLFGPDSR